MGVKPNLLNLQGMKEHLREATNNTDVFKTGRKLIESSC